MTRLTIYPADGSGQKEEHAGHAEIAACLREIGVQLERWEASRDLAPDADQEEVLLAYHDDVERLSRQYGFQSVDVVSLYPEHPDKDTLRHKFLDEHTHADFEIRFFVHGQGLFYLHVNDKVYAVLCTRGDLISVPAGTTHWFDMGENPDFKCIRFFTSADGWVGNFTGSDIAARFPDFDTYLRSLN